MLFFRVRLPENLVGRLLYYLLRLGVSKPHKPILFIYCYLLGSHLSPGCHYQHCSRQKQICASDITVRCRATQQFIQGNPTELLPQAKYNSVRNILNSPQNLDKMIYRSYLTLDNFMIIFNRVSPQACNITTTLMYLLFDW